jgi:NAD(P)-dependent dehydrogenase (short-subunit alcohol dehydrogenase family)
MKTILERFSLDGKNALVTGAGQGLGKAFALCLAEAGANVAAADIVVENAARTAEEIAALGRQSLAIKADISSEEDVRAMISRCIESFGSLDIAVILNVIKICEFKSCKGVVNPPILLSKCQKPFRR